MSKLSQLYESSTHREDPSEVVFVDNYLPVMQLTRTIQRDFNSYNFFFYYVMW